MLHRLSMLAALLFVLVPRGARAFCGFYVAGADAKLFNHEQSVATVPCIVYSNWVTKQEIWKSNFNLIRVPYLNCGWPQVQLQNQKQGDNQD